MARNSDANLGQLFLTGVNSYEGGTIVNGGILNVNSDAALGAAGTSVVLDGLYFNGYLNATLRAIGSISITGRTLTVGTIGNDVGGTIDTNGNEVIFGVGSAITGTTLRKTGDGKLTIAGTQTYDTLTTLAGRTDLASAVGTGGSTINANAETNVSVSQTLNALNIGDGAIVTLGALPPASGAALDGSDNDLVALDGGQGLAGNHVQAVPEPAGAVLLLAGLGWLLGLRRRVGA